MKSSEEILSYWLGEYPESEKYDAALKAMEEYRNLPKSEPNEPSIEAAQERIDYLENKLMLMEKTTVKPEPSIDKVLGLDNAWPLVDVLSKLIEATEILLDKKNYDGHGWEEISFAVKRGRNIINFLNNKPEPSIQDKGLCTCTPDKTTGWIDEHCNICGKEVIEAVYPNESVIGVKFEDRVEVPWEDNMK